MLLRHLRHEPGVSRTRIQRWIDAGDVLVNGQPAPRAAWRLTRHRRRQGSHRGPARARPACRGVDPDRDPLRRRRPARREQAAGSRFASVTSQPHRHAAQRHPGASRAGGHRDREPGLLGRLDKQTSGARLVSKRPAIQAALQRAAAALAVDKDYLAIVWGKPTPLRGTIDLALDRDPWDRRRVTVTDRGGQPAVTRYERLARPRRVACRRFSLVRCRLITGRTHQIRVHLATKGWPIVGDATYGRPHPFPRQALHAWRLTFPHPTTRRRGHRRRAAAGRHEAVVRVAWASDAESEHQTDSP